jgi:hypothetical protein
VGTGAESRFGPTRRQRGGAVPDRSPQRFDECVQLLNLFSWTARSAAAGSPGALSMNVRRV